MYTVRPDVITELETLIKEVSEIDSNDIPSEHESAIRFLQNLNPVMSQISGQLNRNVLALSSGLTMPTLKGVADSASQIQTTMSAYLTGSSIGWRP